jgi:hypothetical protein
MQNDTEDIGADPALESRGTPTPYVRKANVISREPAISPPTPIANRALPFLGGDQCSTFSQSRISLFAPFKLESFIPLVTAVRWATFVVYRPAANGANPSAAQQDGNPLLLLPVDVACSNGHLSHIRPDH